MAEALLWILGAPDRNDRGKILLREIAMRRPRGHNAGFGVTTPSFTMLRWRCSNCFFGRWIHELHKTPVVDPLSYLGWSLLRLCVMLLVVKSLPFHPETPRMYDNYSIDSVQI